MKKRLAAIAFPFSVIVVLILLLSNPNKNQYFARVSQDYTKYHHELQISQEALEQIGKSQRNSYILFSTFSYSVGKLSFHYFGIGNSVFYVGSEYDKKKSAPIKVV